MLAAVDNEPGPIAESLNMRVKFSEFSGLQVEKKTSCLAPGERPLRRPQWRCAQKTTERTRDTPQPGAL